MLTDAQVEGYLRDGFVLGPRVLGDDRIDELRAELDRVIADDGTPRIPQPDLLRNLSGREDAPVWQIVNIWAASEPFRRLVCDADTVAEVARLADASELRLWHDQIQYKPAELGGTTGWHQDAPAWPCLTPPTMVTAWFALDDVDTSNGCMRMVPGSHRWGDQSAFLYPLPSIEAIPDTWEGRDIQVRPCPVPKGHVHFHHSLTWHGSGDNRSGRPRRAIGLHYMTQETRYVAAGRHPIDRFIQVADGEKMQGDHFPLVWAGAPVAA